MDFIRQFKDFNYQKMAKESIFKFIEPEIQKGEIFPALRDNRIDFYYNGGCIYQYTNKGFSYNTDYFKYMDDKYLLLGSNNYLINKSLTIESFHKDLKAGIDQKFCSKNERHNERQYLSQLYTHTYNKKSSTVKIIDIEVYIDRTKCDMVLWDSETKAIQFVEAKLYDDTRLWKKGNTEPFDTLEQIEKYNNAISDQKEKIISQYTNYVDYMNKYFGLSVDSINSLNPSAKLVIFDIARSRFDDNNNRSRKEIINSIYKAKLGKDLYICFDEDQNTITPDAVFQGYYE